MRSLLSIIALVASMAAHAEVYRCQVEGREVFTDKPCAAGAKPAELAPVSVMQAPPPSDLARQWDERTARERKARDRTDKAWLEKHEASKTREERVRNGRVTGKVVRGMTAADVRSVLGAPDGSTRDDGKKGDREKWTYTLGDGRKQTVTFQDGEVSAVSIAKGKGRK
ncbi:MAG TPA: DUF4124 domain-containing protein [Solimonas sp.]|nr:DUF4124 domain-containing protein [Solimonas sp.]